MSVPVATLRQHILYTEWASARLLDAASKLSEQELNRDFGHADRSVLGTLVHIFAGDRAWLRRVEYKPPVRFVDPEADMKLSAIQQGWPAIHEGWKAYLSAATDETVERKIEYKDLKGNPYSTPLWQIVLHVVNHASHHRGQVSAMLRAMGHAPPGVDLIHYYRSLG